ncbi:MAG: ATP-binding cassette domain-containing protein [Candidatus Eremiobacteraeota bacterium]|nr:ATP-binding cassette domain-containing protein [Candidatus Eremiobacteraeota bacterium]
MGTEPCIDFAAVSKSFRLPQIRTNSLGQRLYNFLGTGLIRQETSRLEVLKSLSFQVYPGEQIALMGPNGAGKSTLLKLIASILAPTSGAVQVRGRVAPLLQMGVGFHPELTGRENVSLSCSLHGMNRTEIQDLMPAIFDFSELEDKFLDTPVKYYSSGMKARLAFSVSSSIEADIYLLDEGIGAGDVAFKDKSQQRIQQLLRKKKTWIVTSHNLGELGKFFSRVFLLCDGQLSVRTSLAEALSEYRLMSQGQLRSSVRSIQRQPDHLQDGQRRVTIQNERCQGGISQVFFSQTGVTLVGWASDRTERSPAREILIFSDNRCLGKFPVNEERPGLAESLSLEAGRYGFRVELGEEWLPPQDLNQLEIFACSGDSASEIPLHQARSRPSPPAMLAITHPHSGFKLLHKLLRSAIPDIRTGLDGELAPGALYGPLHHTRAELDQLSNPSQRRLLFIRDLRDSLAQAYLRKRSDTEPTDQATALQILFEEFLPSLAAIQASWLESSIQVFRYEDLVRAPLETMRDILKHCEVPVPEKKLRKFSKLEESPLAPGIWRDLFSSELREQFGARYGDLLIKTGYESDLSWTQSEVTACG